MSLPYTTSIDLLTGQLPSDSVGVTVDTTGLGYEVSKRQQIVVQFLCKNHTSGSGAFTIDGSMDNVNWVTSLAVQDLTATASTTFVTSVTLSSNSSKGVKVPAGWKYVRAVCDVTTDGTYYAFMEAAG